MAQIVRLEAENVKRLTALRIEPGDGNMVVIGGENGQGKSSALDCIEYALGGKKHLPGVPIHKGADKARIVLETDKLIVERTFTESDSYIKVRNKEGMTFSSPQDILDTLVGDLSFDPLAFTRMDAAKQSATFQRLLGLDFADLDAEYKQVEADRRDIGRDGQSVKSLLASIPEDPDAPAAEINIAALAKQISEGQDTNAQNEAVRNTAWRSANTLSVARQRIDALREELIAAEAEVEKALKAESADRAKAEACVDVDLEPLNAQLAEAETTNRRVRKQSERKVHADKFAELDKTYKTKTARLEAIKTTKAKMIADAKFPVDGVGFDASGVTVNGLPFDQASQAEQLQVAVAMGLSANPKLRVILIRDGSLLDDNSLAAMAKLAEEYDAQVWMERVGAGAEVSVVIRDGKVLEDRTQTPPVGMPELALEGAVS